MRPGTLSLDFIGSEKHESPIGPPEIALVGIDNLSDSKQNVDGPCDAEGARLVDGELDGSCKALGALETDGCLEVDGFIELEGGLDVLGVADVDGVALDGGELWEGG